jgi:mannose-6-phosphate isomerase-like protein (cupin superfamily)
MTAPQVLAPTPSRPHIIRAGQGEEIGLFGDSACLLLTEEKTEGKLLLGLSHDSPGSGPPLHVHEREDELFLVQSGCYEFVLGSQSVEGGAGAVVFGPRGLPHTHRVVSEEPGRMLSACLPARYEGFVRLFARECATGAPNRSRIAEVSRSFGVSFLSPEDAQRLAEHAESNGVAPRIVPPNEGECWEARGNRARLVLTGAQTGGALGLVELCTPPGDGPSPHVHSREEEVFLVQQGLYEFQIEGERVQAGTGDVVYAPRPHQHAFRVLGDEPGRMLVLFAPGGVEAFFPRVLKYLRSVDGPPDPRVMTSIGEELGLVSVVDAEVAR